MLVIKDTAESFVHRLERMAELCSTVVHADILLYTPKKLREMVADGNAIVIQALQGSKGKFFTVLREQSNPGNIVNPLRRSNTACVLQTAAEKSQDGNNRISTEKVDHGQKIEEMLPEGSGRVQDRERTEMEAISRINPRQNGPEKEYAQAHPFPF